MLADLPLKAIGARHRVGIGHTMTVEEYLAAPWYKKAGYRIMRTPWILFTVGAVIVFGVTHRFWVPGAGKRARSSVIWTDLAVFAIIAWLVLEVGWAAFLMVQLLVMLIACGAGVWLFYVQHNFDPTYWERHKNWDFFNAGMDGSSFYKLPKILQWCTGNIGFHHIHHLSPRIPNYNLERCHRADPLFQQVRPIRFVSSLKSLTFGFWDEKRKRLVGYRGMREQRKDFWFIHKQGLMITRGRAEVRPRNNPQLMEHNQRQIRELLTQYGKVDTLYFDGDTSGLKKLVWELQPDVVVTRGYMKTPEQAIPADVTPGPWETAFVMGTQWGYKATNERFKSGTDLISMLIEIRAKGGNLALDVGPEPSGLLQPEQERLLIEIGLWNLHQS